MGGLDLLFYAALLFVTAEVIRVLLIRTFPEILGGAILKGIERRNTEQIEKLRDELARESARELEHLRADYQTLRASTEYVAANQSELRGRMIGAVEALWNEMLGLRNEFGSLINFETIFLPTEIAGAFERGENPQIINFVTDYQHEGQLNNKAIKFGASGSEKFRLFVGDKLWLTYFVFRAFILRLAYMTNQSFKKKKYINWREDETTLRLLRTVLGEVEVKKALQAELPALNAILASLEAQFLPEAMRIMSGSKVYADSIADVRATMALETARVRADASVPENG